MNCALLSFTNRTKVIVFDDSTHYESYQTLEASGRPAGHHVGRLAATRDDSVGAGARADVLPEQPDAT